MQWGRCVCERAPSTVSPFSDMLLKKMAAISLCTGLPAASSARAEPGIDDTPCLARAASRRAAIAARAAFAPSDDWSLIASS